MARRLLPLLVLLFVLFGASAAWAQKAAPTPPPSPAPSGGSGSSQSASDVEEARKHYSLALEMFADGAFEPACIEFERAYDLAPSYKILYNIGTCYRQVNNFVRAIRALSKYIEDAGDQITAERRTEVNRVLTELRARAAQIDVTTEAGAQVTVDDEPIGTAPLGGPVLVNPGRRRVSAIMAGKPNAVLVVTLGAGETKKLELKFNAISQEQRTRVVQPRSPAPWIVGGIGVALLAGAGVTGAVTLSKVSDLKDICSPTCPSDNPDYSSKRTSAKTFTTLTDVLWISGAALTAGAAVWLLVRPKAEIAKSFTPSFMCSGTGCFAGLGKTFQ